MIDQELVEILACPEDKSPVTLAPPDLVALVNRAIAAGQLKNRAGASIGEPIEAGLVREDGKWLYPVREEIPVMLMDEAIALPPPSVE